MMRLILGGSASGKSEYAEGLAGDLAGDRPLFYLATMQEDGEETLARIDRHVRRREGMGFHTLEIPYDLDCSSFAEALGPVSPSYLPRETGGVILLECVSNLLANQIFDRRSGGYDQDRFCEGILGLGKLCQDLVIVSNNVHEDGIQYDPMTQNYIRQLGQINRRLARSCGQVTEIVAGLPLQLKE